MIHGPEAPGKLLKGSFARSDSGVGDHARDLGVVSVRNEHLLAELAFHFGRLGRKDVPCLRLVPDDFAGASLFEALGRALMGFQLGHCFLDVLVILERDKALRRHIGAETSRNLKAPLSIPESGF